MTMLTIFTMLALLTILALCLENLKKYQRVGDKIFDQLINELILVLQGDTASKNLPHYDNFFISHNKKGTLAFAEENWNPEGNEQAM